MSKIKGTEKSEPNIKDPIKFIRVWEMLKNLPWSAPCKSSKKYSVDIYLRL
uniref:Uncharacterized protein n=1 Tax=Octopus bimaculoides TaxID=37653 RepID=A0A0L8I8J3_OCTBM